MHQVGRDVRRTYSTEKQTVAGSGQPFSLPLPKGTVHKFVI